MRTIEMTGDPKQADKILRLVERNGEIIVLAHNGVKKSIIGPYSKLEGPSSNRPSLQKSPKRRKTITTS